MLRQQYYYFNQSDPDVLIFRDDSEDIDVLLPVAFHTYFKYLNFHIRNLNQIQPNNYLTFLTFSKC